MAKGGFDPEKDKVLKQWKHENSGLLVSINQYAEGQPKFQIGPRVITRKDGTPGVPMKAGRLSIEEVIWLHDTFDEIKDELTNLIKPE